MMRKSIGIIMVLLVASQAMAQLNLSEQLKKVMNNYENLEHYRIEIYTETHHADQQVEVKRINAGIVVKRGNDYYVKNDQKEIYQHKGKRVEVDNNSKYVIYYPVAGKHASFWKAYEPDWKLIDEKSKEIMVSKKGGRTSYRIPVNQFQIKEIEYVINNKNNLIDELIYYYSTNSDEDVDQIKVIYKNDLTKKPTNATFSFAKILNVGKKGEAALTQQYKNFEFINTSSYETQN